MFLADERVENFVDHCYTKATQIKIYSKFISAIRGSNQWASERNLKPILPPEIRRPLKRPHKNRRKEADEQSNKAKISKRGYKANCKKCGKPEHNVKTCKGEVGGNSKLNATSTCKKSRVPKLPVRRATNAGGTSVLLLQLILTLLRTKDSKKALPLLFYLLPQ